MELVKVFAIILVVIGVLSSFTLDASFLTSSYSNGNFHGVFRENVSFDFVIGDAVFQKGNLTNFGFLYNLTYLGTGQYLTYLSAYELTGNNVGFNINSNSSLPFYGKVNHLFSATKILNNSSQLISSFISPSSSINTSIIHTTLNSNPIPLGPEPVLGYPYYYLGSTPNLDYLKYGSHYVMGGFGGGALNLSAFTSTYDGSLLLSPALSSSVALWHTNDLPSQDWQALTIAGYYYIFPVNLGMIGAGIMLGLVYLRRTK